MDLRPRPHPSTSTSRSSPNRAIRRAARSSPLWRARTRTALWFHSTSLQPPIDGVRDPDRMCDGPSGAAGRVHAELSRRQTGDGRCRRRHDRRTYCARRLPNGTLACDDDPLAGPTEIRTLLDRTAMPSGRLIPMTFPDRSHQLQPLVEPQLGQAWQLPARIIWTPHCMHIGASEWRTMPRAGGVVLGCDRSETELHLARAAHRPTAPTSDRRGSRFPATCRIVDSSTPGSVGWMRSAIEKMPSSARSS